MVVLVVLGIVWIDSLAKKKHKTHVTVGWPNTAVTGNELFTHHSRNHYEKRNS